MTIKSILPASLLLLGAGSLLAADDPTEYAKFEESAEYVKFALNNLWILISAALVFIMHLGFASLESGLCQRKNTVNILFKNCFIIAMGVMTYFFIGFNTHYPSEWLIDGVLAIGGPAGAEAGSADFTAAYNPGYTYWADFIFQAMFAATAATIVSGAVAERVKLPSFLIFATLLVALAYPIAGSWHWGTGFLSRLGGGEAAFYDFAGTIFSDRTVTLQAAQ